MMTSDARGVKTDFDLSGYTKFHSPGYVINVYNGENSEEYIIGNRATIPIAKKCNANTLYDIASLTKIYTATLVYIAYEENTLNLYSYIKDIDDRFRSLTNVRVIDLLSHNQEIWTDGYLGDAKSKEDFYAVLFSSKVKSSFPTYTDVHYIILSTLLERIYGQSFDKLLREKIFDVLGFRRSTTSPQSDNIAPSDCETEARIVHDTKARTGKTFGVTTGHASIFATAGELLGFLKSFFDCTLLSQDTIGLMLTHDDRNGENYNILKKIVISSNINKMYQEAIRVNPDIRLLNTYNNMGARYRNDIDALNDVPQNCGYNTIVFSGYTGPSILIDFDKRIIVVVMCNVLYNTQLNRFERKQITNQIINDAYNNRLKS